MKTIKKSNIQELVGGDFNSIGGNKPINGDSEIETGPITKTPDDMSNYEKGMPTTTDKMFSRYRQNIPWFAVYSYGSSREGRVKTFESKAILTKTSVEEKISDLVKKSNSLEVTDKDYNPKVANIIDTIEDAELNDKQLDDLKKAIASKISSKTL